MLGLVTHLSKQFFIVKDSFFLFYCVSKSNSSHILLYLMIHEIFYIDQSLNYWYALIPGGSTMHNTVRSLVSWTGNWGEKANKDRKKLERTILPCYWRGVRGRFWSILLPYQERDGRNGVHCISFNQKPCFNIITIFPINYYIIFYANFIHVQCAKLISSSLL